MTDNMKWVTIEYPCYHCQAWHRDINIMENDYICHVDGHRASSKEGLSMNCPDKEKYDVYKKINEENIQKLENMR